MPYFKNRVSQSRLSNEKPVPNESALSRRAKISFIEFAERKQITSSQEQITESKNELLRVSPF
jgi:hypothetical protein